MRLSAYIKAFGNYTKSEVLELQKEKRIKVNNEFVSLISNVNDNDIITVDDKQIERIPFKYFLYYKPRGILSVVDKSENSYINNIKSDIKLMPAGRLDKESEGLLILTNDGEYIDYICSPNTHAEKEYEVTVKFDITDEFIKKLNGEFVLSGKKLKPMKCQKLDSKTVMMILEEGVYHQIRRCVKESFNTVVNLKRVRINSFRLNDMAPGELIEITSDKLYKL